MTTHDYSETSNARRIPVELANAREACTQTWNRYFVVIEREHTYEEYHQALNEAGAADDLCSDLYRRWQAVGGTSDIESIEAAELEQSDLLPCGHSIDSLGGFGGCNPNGSCLECLKLEQEQHKALKIVLDVTAPKLPPAKNNTLQSFAEAREIQFNQFYYGNKDGLPYFPTK